MHRVERLLGVERAGVLEACATSASRAAGSFQRVWAMRSEFAFRAATMIRLMPQMIHCDQRL